MQLAAACLFKSTVMQIDKALINERLRLSKVFRKFRISITYNFAVICSNLPVKFAIFLNNSLLLTGSIVFSVYKQDFMAQ